MAPKPARSRVAFLLELSLKSGLGVEAMTRSQLRPVKEALHLLPEEYALRMRNLQRREWWTWGASIAVMLLLTAAIASLSFPAIFESSDRTVGSRMFQTIGGLVGLIFLFVCYLTYEKSLLNRLRLNLAEQQAQSAFWRNLALVDPLTGLYNRRFAERRLKAEIARCQRKGYDLTLVMFDLNFFKQINDRYGHAAGDAVIREFASRLTTAIREADVAARLGGDEFLLLLTECDPAMAAGVLERLDAIEAEWNGQRIPIHFAFGISEYNPGKQAEDMLREADLALYSRKPSRLELVPAGTK
jgi:diguanylate cyclase (GGDEF)-like protein